MLLAPATPAVDPGEQRRRLAGLYGRFLKPGNLCFDVGAHRGERTDVFLELGAKVVSVEPQPACVEHLRQKYSARGDVNIVPQGLAASSGILTLSVCADADVLSTFSSRWKTGRFRDFEWGHTVDVQVGTLDQLVQRFGVPDFCKIDVEGFEHEVLRGLSRPLPALSFEFTREFLDDARLCMRRLEELGMARFNAIFGEGSEFELPKWVAGDALVAHLLASSDRSLWGDIFAVQGS